MGNEDAQHNALLSEYEILCSVRDLLIIFCKQYETIYGRSPRTAEKQMRETEESIAAIEKKLEGNE